jgi:hypothetical protein
MSRSGRAASSSIFSVKLAQFGNHNLAIMYCFYGISLATQNYINPSIDIIKAKGVVRAF